MSRILIIEDDALTRENLAIILQMEGFVVRTAADGAAGLKAACEEPPDLIVCDISMPRLGGREVLAALRANPAIAMIPFVFLTALGGSAAQRAGMNLGADDYIGKPVDAEDLLAAIRVRLQRHQEKLPSPSATKLLPDFSSPAPLEKLGLTPREAEVLLWVAQGKANADVATILALSEKTVKIHLGHIFAKLHVETRTAAARVAIESLPPCAAAPRRDSSRDPAAQ